MAEVIEVDPEGYVAEGRGQFIAQSEAPAAPKPTVERKPRTQRRKTETSKTESEEKKVNKLKGQFKRSEGEELSPAAREVSTMILSFSVAYVAAKMVEQSVHVELNDDEAEALAISQVQANQMFNPIMARLEKIDTVVVVLNRISEQKDLVACGLAWKRYFNKVSEVKKSAGERLAKQMHDAQLHGRPPY